MFQSAKKDLLYKLVDSMTIIKGNAQLASEAGNIKWSRDYLEIIIREIDQASALLKSIALIADKERPIRKTTNRKPFAALN